MKEKKKTNAVGTPLRVMIQGTTIQVIRIIGTVASDQRRRMCFQE